MNPARRRGNRSPSGGRPWQFSIWSLLVLTTMTRLLSLLSVSRAYPLQALIMAAAIAIAVVGVILYIGELFLIGWVVDFLADLGMPKFQAKSAPLDCELIGEIIVVTLRDNIATAAQCQSVAKQLNHLIGDHHCDFILDFSYAGRISMNFREVMLNLLKAARKERRVSANRIDPLICRKGIRFESSMTESVRSQKCLRAADMAGLSSAASRLECERSPS